MHLQSLKKWFTLRLQGSGYLKSYPLWLLPHSLPPHLHTGVTLGYQIWKVNCSGQCIWGMVTPRSRLDTEHAAPSRNLGHTIHRRLCLHHLDSSRKWRVGKDCKVFAYYVTVSCHSTDTVIISVSLYLCINKSSGRLQIKDCIKEERKLKVHVVPLSFLIWYLLFSNIIGLGDTFRKSKKPPSLQSWNSVYLVLADHLGLCKNPQSKVSTSRRDFHDSFI